VARDEEAPVPHSDSIEHTDHAARPDFASRHIGPSPDEIAKMLAAVGAASLDDLVDQVVPEAIRTARPLDLPPAATEAEVLDLLHDLASRNRVTVPMIGAGWSDCVTPSVIRRVILENPAWYTAYTPYQPEISQGRLEALLNFQTVVADLTGLPIAGASLLDEATAAAEAMMLCRRVSKSTSRRFVVDGGCHPQTRAVLAARAEPLGVELVEADLGDPAAGELLGEAFGVLVASPTTDGRIRDLAPIVAAARAHEALVAVTTDLLALTLFTAPGAAGADVAVGSAQRLGVPLGFGGPHAGFMAVRQGLERSLPGRLVGVSVDADGAPAYRLALQTREQHIRRERATSNICTAQVLLAVIAGAYAVYHGPDGLRAIAEGIRGYAEQLRADLRAGGIDVVEGPIFDTVVARVPGRAADVVAAAEERGVSLRLIDADTVGVSADECTVDAHLDVVRAAFGVTPAGADLPPVPAELTRDADYLLHPVFRAHHSETSLLRYLRRLADRDLALDRTMIPLGSCTMKLNAATEMEPITWPEFARIHPFAPPANTAGYRELIGDLERWLAEITGYAAVSLQPNAGSQGEFAGLLAIRGWHRDRGEPQRDVCLIPASAHGTNAASAAMAGMRVVVVACDGDGNVSLDDLSAKLAEHAGRVAAIMVTYPSTHGVFEAQIRELCDRVHEAGGQVYVDGANLNALVGLSRMAEWGADVSHLNLHKTFCIPHGGGGPGVGPVAVREHLAGYLPRHPADPQAGPATGVGPVAGAPYGSAGILPIPWAYLRLMGPEGLTRATQTAILAANYVAKRLAPHYPVLYTGRGGLVAHECILDLRPLTKETGVTAEDVAKRLIDFGFHAPTMSFPVSGTLMVEPTESEDLAELDRFCDAMIAIREEIADVARGRWPVADSPLRGAPHTAECLLGDWDRPYDRIQAAYPGGVRRADKYWPPVRRIDQGYGDRNLTCSCPPLDAWT
jgi:glycine dehydrogenase